MNDPELFELCKKVYERLPDWKHTDLYLYKRDGDERGWHYIGNGNRGISYGNMQSGFTLDEKDHLIPLYTSDYILEKLKNTRYLSLAYPSVHKNDHWFAMWGMSRKGISDTPLKALLKLVIALHKAGELS